MSTPAPRREGPGRPRGPRPPISSRSQPIIRSFKDYLVMLRERWLWGLGAALLIGGGLFFFLMNRPAVYSTFTTVLFENPVQPLDLRPVTGGFGKEINLATHIEQIRSSSFRDYVAASFTPEEVALIRAAYLEPDLSPSEQPGVEGIIQGAIDVIERRDTPILELAAHHRDPRAAELIANRYARRYIEFNLDRTASGTNSALVFLEEEERKLRQQYEQAQERLQEYVRSNNTVSLSEGQNVVSQRLDSLANERNAAKNERLRLETTLQQVEAVKERGEDLVKVAYISGFRSIGGLLQEIDALKAERALLEQRYLENHPRMIANTRSLETKNGQLSENIALAIAELQGAYARAQQHEERMVRAQDGAEKDALDLQQTAIAYNLLKKEVDGTSELLDNVIRQKKETAIQTQLDNVNIKIIDRAWVSVVPSDPNLVKSLLQASVLAAVFFIGIPIGLGLLDVRLKAAWEIEQFLEQTLLGEIPAIAGVARKERAHIMAKDLDHAASEAFRGLFGQIQLNSTVPYPKTLMITSTLPGEGKSIVANNLAATFASHGKKTLLIDFDFRRPNLHLFYNKDNACGALRWLNAGGQLTSSPEEDPELGILPVKQNLYLLRAGGEHRRATELFETESFIRLVKTVRSHFDITLIDTPPLGVFPDAMLISRICDEVMYICRFNAVNRSKIRKTLERLKQSSAVFSGIVLNGLPTGAQSAYYDYYGYGSNESKRYKAYYAQKR